MIITIISTILAICCGEQNARVRGGGNNVETHNVVMLLVLEACRAHKLAFSRTQ